MGKNLGIEESPEDISNILSSVNELLEKARRDKANLSADIALLEREKHSLETDTDIIKYSESERQARISRINEAIETKKAALSLTNALLDATQKTFGGPDEKGQSLDTEGSQPEYSHINVRR